MGTSPLGHELQVEGWFPFEADPALMRTPDLSSLNRS
jgi:hypothetical protein